MSERAEEPVRITRPDGEPLPENHHLEYRPDKKTWRMKFTANVNGSRFVGKRLVVPLNTGDVKLARQMRDVIIIAMTKTGIMSRRVRLSDEETADGGDDLLP